MCEFSQHVQSQYNNLLLDSRGPDKFFLLQHKQLNLKFRSNFVNCIGLIN